MTTPAEHSHDQRSAAVLHLREALNALPAMDLSIRQQVMELIDQIEALEELE